MAKVAFLGLGVMGFPMAGHLQAAGHEVTVFNRTAAKAEAWVAQHGGKMALTPGEAAADAEFVMACVGNDDDLRHVCVGEGGAFAGMKPGAIFVDHTTVSAKVTSELYGTAKEAGLNFVDAPISGGQAGAENGVLHTRLQMRCRDLVLLNCMLQLLLPLQQQLQLLPHQFGSCLHNHLIVQVIMQ